jgi:transposase
MNMSKKLFTKQELTQLKLNPYVKTVSQKSITYTDEFKQFFIIEDEAGKFPREIFAEAGFDIEAIGIKRVQMAAERWRTAYKELGVTGLEDSRKYSSGRPSERELSIGVKYARLEAKVKLLEAENEFLKKLDQLERQMMRKKSK